MTEKRIPISKARSVEASMAWDWVQEEHPEVLQAYQDELVQNFGMCRMAYLRRVPKIFVIRLTELLPHGSVEWEFERPHAWHPRVETIRHPCFPVCILDAIMEFMRPAGKQHVAVISVNLAPNTHTKLEPPSDVSAVEREFRTPTSRAGEPEAGE